MTFPSCTGDVKHLEGGWYVTHSGLLRLAQRRRCVGIHSRPVLEASNPQSSHWIFKAPAGQWQELLPLAADERSGEVA